MVLVMYLQLLLIPYSIMLSVLCKMFSFDES